jgi:hypothetical protein
LFIVLIAEAMRCECHVGAGGCPDNGIRQETAHAHKKGSTVPLQLMLLAAAQRRHNQASKSKHSRA